MPETINWSVLGGQMGFGVLLGYAVGFAAKKALKVFLVILGILIVLGASLQSYGFITVNWAEIEGAYLRTMESAGGLRNLVAGWADRLGATIPVTGSFGLGFFLGLRRG